MIGEYREIAAPERLSFTWKWDGGAMGELPETIVTVTLKEQRADHGIETVVTLLHSGFPSASARDGHVVGWNSMLSRLVYATDARGTAATLTFMVGQRSSYVRSVLLAMVDKCSTVYY